MDWLSMERWSPYAVGVSIGILSWITFLLSDKPIGCSTAFSRTSGMLERLIRGEKVREKAYYKKFAPEIDWEWMLVLGIFLGALISALFSGSFQLIFVPSKWEAAFGSSSAFRWVASLIGGIVLGFGARWPWGSGCSFRRNLRNSDRRGPLCRAFSKIGSDDSQQGPFWSNHLSRTS
jgi:hypothetical protein